jgi:hypothetical protein
MMSYDEILVMQMYDGQFHTQFQSNEVKIQNKKVWS